MPIRIKRTSGKTWATLKGGDFFDQKFLNEIGTLLVDAIVLEAGKDFAKQGNQTTPRGAPEGIPGSLKFFDSFGHRIIKNTQVEIYSTWPWIEQIVEGRRPYPMDWLTKQDGMTRVPMPGPRGTVLVKTTPSGGQDAWIHPGFAKHTFVRRGYDRARRQMNTLLNKRVTKVLTGTSIL